MGSNGGKRIGPERSGLSKRILWATLTASLCTSALAGSATAQSYTWKNVQIVGGGFVPGIVYSEAEPGLVYARTDIGGAYRLNRATGRWVPLLDGVGWDQWGYTGVASLAPDPSDANVVYAAVGTYTNEWDPNNGAILKSIDRGNTWTTAPLPFKLGGNMPGRGNGERLAVDPNNSNIVYFAATGNDTTTFGLWRSVDAGASWSDAGFPAVGEWREDPSDPFGYLDTYQGLSWIVFDRRLVSGAATQNIYVGVATKTGPTVWRSTDAGESWAPVPGQPISFPGGWNLMPTKAKFEPAAGILYITYGYKAGPYDDGKGDVWKYDTGTDQWTLISPVVNDGVTPGEGNPYFGYNGLAIDRQNPNTIMVTAHSSWWPDTIVWRSNNGGASWSKIWDWSGTFPNRSFRYVQNITAAPWLFWNGGTGTGGRQAEVFPKLGWMTASLEIDPFNRNEMMYGTGATIYGSDNLTVWDQSGTSQITIKVKAMGLEETAVQALVSPPVGPQLLSGMYDIFGFVHGNVDVVPNAFYTNPTFATVSIDYAEANPAIIWRSGTPSGSGQTTIRGAARSTNSGSSWAMAGAQPSGTTDGGTIAVASDGARVMWAPDGAAGVYYSTNNGKNWTLAAGAPAGSIVRSDRVTASKFYAFGGGTFYRSTNGTSFTATGAAGLPSDGNFKAVAGFGGHLWLGSGTGLWRSTDSGSTFAQLGNIEAADAIGFGKPAPGQTYPALYTSGKVGGVRGIYRSTDQGASWLRVNDDQHQYGFTGKDITGDPRIFGRVYLATNGRGIIYGDIATAPPPTVPNAPTNLIATAGSSSQINLSWLDNSGDETAFLIEQASDVGFTQGRSLRVVPANTTSLQVTGLATETTYYFRARAGNEAGESANSNVASATTAGSGLGTTSHVHSITVGVVGGGTNQRGQALVTVRDDLGGLVPDATVTGTFTGSFNETASGVTNASGVATLTTAGTNRGNISFTFCVTNITHAELTYNSSQNVVTCASR
jgi:xyloglucan-specific exo-beta-1,4-glucanase